MKPQPNLIDDLLKLAESTLSLLPREGLGEKIRAKACKFKGEDDSVSRDEFESALAMIAKARQNQEDLAARLSAIEAALNLKTQTKPAKKPARRLPSVKQDKTRKPRKK